MSDQEKVSEIRPNFWGVLFVVVFMCFAMAAQIFILEGADWVTHITLIIVIVVTSIVAMASGFKWKDIQDGILYGCQLAMLPMLILMMVGVLVASWIAAGTIPTLIYYGLKTLSPSIFLLTVCLVCSVSSLATGSSWTTGATFGVAFMGVGLGLGIPAAMTAGAVVSGSIFGDKMSPLSDSTNLAAAVGEADLFDHIKSMMYTTGPAILISLVLYGIIGARFGSGTIDNQQVDTILTGLKANYWINPVTMIPPVLIIVMAVKKVSGLAAMVIGSLVGMIFAIVFQGYSLSAMLNFMNDGFVSSTGIAEVDALLSRGGLQSMMWTISLGFIALSLGGLLEKTNMLSVLLERISGLVSNVRGLIITHVLSSIFINVIAASQYIAIIIPGRMLVPAYKKQKILPQVCSRTCEDSATVTSPLVPWGLCGVYFAGVLGVSTMEYFPYTFLAFLAPLIAIIFALTNKFIWKEGEKASVNTYNSVEEKLNV